MSIDTERASEIERQRQVLLREFADERDPEWTEAFKPGSFGCHELLDRTNLIVNLVEDNILNHPSCALNQEWYALADHATAILRDLYQRIGAEQH